MKYHFNISLSILNHLGRNLYRNFVTVLGEAVSNSWDADADNVWIEIDREKRTMFVIDDGVGMSGDDFQDKFLKIGYSKRKDNILRTEKCRPYIGRKGIGKLALLSCAEKVHVVSKAIGHDLIGGLINNTGLDQAIIDDVTANEYELETYDLLVADKLKDLSSGTAIYFEDLKDGVINRLEYLKDILALYFRFALIDKSFNIHLNGELVTLDSLEKLSSATQFVWQINDIDDPYLKTKISSESPNIKSYNKITSNLNIRGFIATTIKPSNLKIRETNEKASIDLFVNGRLREKDILKHIPTARIVESYAYGQIHFDDLDYDTDVFTSSREGIVSDDPKFKELILEIKRIFTTIINDWDELRLNIGDDGDSENHRIPPKQRKARELYTATIHEILPKELIARDVSGIVAEWIKVLSVESQFNIPSYTECFIAENLLRKYITEQSVALTREANAEVEKYRRREKDSKSLANISFKIRHDDNDLQYLDMADLANLVDKPKDPNKEAGISRSAKIYKPLRDAVGHTSLLTENAKNMLNLEFKNIQARLQEILDIKSNKNK